MEAHPMSDDLVKRLLYRANQWGMENTSDQRLLLEAADEIVRLEHRLEVAWARIDRSDASKNAPPQ